MTEAGKEFVQKHLQPLFPSSNEIEECLLVLRAFVALVNERADKWRTPGESQSPAGPVFNALNEVVRELLGAE